ncbi:hypothetical protein RJ640_013739 [Escallonia rubra]|uniref:CCHC-type domain-containing protein n=1 Tax=Escallonia rubra TaxID=112253 RepID=A0AA88R9F7_9ASTE|nr:hypothetical protein RJ640_013739 [Escallonia rubra]
MYGGRHDEQTYHTSDTVVEAYNSRENADSLTENEVINWISYTRGTHNKQRDAASSMEQEVIDTGNVGHEGEQINGSISTGGDHSEQNAESSDNGGASDNQLNASSSTRMEVVNAVYGGHHDDQIDAISKTGGVYDYKEEMTLIPNQVVINADGNGGHSGGQFKKFLTSKRDGKIRRNPTNQSYQRNNSDWNVKENPDACYECGRTGHIKKYCPQLKNKTASSNSRDFKEKKFKSRKALLTWDDSDKSDKEISEDDEVAQLCFMAKDDNSKVILENLDYNELKSAFLELSENYEKLKMPI